MEFEAGWKAGLCMWDADISGAWNASICREEPWEGGESRANCCREICKSQKNFLEAKDIIIHLSSIHQHDPRNLCLKILFFLREPLSGNLPPPLSTFRRRMESNTSFTLLAHSGQHLPFHIISLLQHYLFTFTFNFHIQFWGWEYFSTIQGLLGNDIRYIYLQRMGDICRRNDAVFVALFLGDLQSTPALPRHTIGCENIRNLSLLHNRKHQLGRRLCLWNIFISWNFYASNSEALKWWRLEFSALYTRQWE